MFQKRTLCILKPKHVLIVGLVIHPVLLDSSIECHQVGLPELAAIVQRQHPVWVSRPSHLEPVSCILLHCDLKINIIYVKFL